MFRYSMHAGMGLDVDYRHSGVIPFDWMGGIILPKTDCSQYKFWFQIQGHAHSLPFKAYVKNLNAIITVVDGCQQAISRHAIGMEDTFINLKH